jgi:hypothetical protein
MVKGRIQSATTELTVKRWMNDRLDDCSVDDRIWGYSIRSSEVLSTERKKIDDQVLEDMIITGLVDPKPHAPAWAPSLSIQQGVRLASNAIVRVLQQVLKVEDQVSHSVCLWLFED